MFGLPLAGLAARAEAAPDQLVLSNKTGITVRPSPEQPEAPMVCVDLPGPSRQRCAVIEMPEHSWGRPRGSTEQKWFYRMYSDDRAARPPTRWTKDRQSLRSSLTLPSGVRLETTLTLEADGMTMVHRLENHGTVDYEEVQAPTCIKLYRPFSDVFLERTYVHHPEGVDLVASETPGRLDMNAEEWLPVRYIVHCVPPVVPPEKRIEKQDQVVRYHKGRLADAPFIATASAPAGWVAASHTLVASSLFTNPARTCHHVDPAAALPPGGTATLSLKLYLLRGTVADAWRLISRNRAQGRV